MPQHQPSFKPAGSNSYQKLNDPNTNRPYWLNIATGQVSWDPPPGELLHGAQSMKPNPRPKPAPPIAVLPEPVQAPPPSYSHSVAGAPTTPKPSAKPAPAIVTLPKPLTASASDASSTSAKLDPVAPTVGSVRPVGPVIERDVGPTSAPAVQVMPEPPVMAKQISESIYSKFEDPITCALMADPVTVSLWARGCVGTWGMWVRVFFF